MRLRRSTPIALVALASSLTPITACTTVERGEDFAIADVVYDENYFYCHVEPMMFAQSCGPGDPSQGDGTGSCHFNVTTFRLINYSPLVAEACAGGDVVATGTPIPPQAKSNYTSASSKMSTTYTQAPLYNRPTSNSSHPRVVIAPDSPEAQIIKDWAQKFSSQ